MSKNGVKIYQLFRNEDVSGVSGTGAVADVVELSNGKVVVGWYINAAGVPGLGIYDSIEDVRKIHGHQGRTVLKEAE